MAMAYADVRPQIRKFDGKDFHPWQVLIKYKMMERGYWPLIQGTRVVDPTDLTDVEDDQRAQAIIMLHLDESLIHHVDQLATAKEKWDELEKLYGATGKNTKIFLKIEFFSLEYKQGEDLGKFISHMKGLMAQLSSVQAPIHDEDAIAILLKAVKKVFPTLVTTLTNIPNPTLASTIQSCLDEEKRSHKEGSTSHDQLLVHTVVTKCAFCNKKGHLISNCWKKYPDKMKCNKCKKTGHITSKCPNNPEASQALEANYVSKTSDDRLF